MGLNRLSSGGSQEDGRSLGGRNLFAKDWLPSHPGFVSSLIEISITTRAHLINCGDGQPLGGLEAEPKTAMNECSVQGDQRLMLLCLDSTTIENIYRDTI